MRGGVGVWLLVARVQGLVACVVACFCACTAACLRAWVCGGWWFVCAGTGCVRGCVFFCISCGVVVRSTWWRVVVD